MSRLSKSKLQAALDVLTAATNTAHAARTKIANHCIAVYGCEPGDVDYNEFIDAVDGGCGTASGMSAEAFEAGMAKAVSRNGGGLDA